MKLLAIAIGLAVLGGGSLRSQELPQWVLQLSQVKRKAKADLARLPDFACVETISRFQRMPPSEVFKPLDSIRLEVAFVEGKELVAPAGGTVGFQDMDLKHLASGGVIGTGAFSAVARNLFVNDNGRTTGMEEDRILDRPALRFHFVVPAMLAGYTVSSNGAAGSVGLDGAFWADAETLELLRIEEHAVDIPAALGIEDTSTTVTYAKMRIGASDALLPRSAEVVVNNTNGWRARNEIEFTACREYVAESVIHFDTDAPPPPAKKK